MKKRSKIIIASIMAAFIIAAAPTAAFSPVTLTAEAATVAIPNAYGVKAVTTTGTLTVTVPESVSDSYEVRAYEMLRLVVPKDSNYPTSMTNETNSKNVYYVTDPFVDFFKTAKETYNDADDPLTSKDTLYLTYDTTNNHLNLTAAAETVQGKKENEDYIVIDNRKYKKDSGNPLNNQPGRLDKNYFEADLVSRIESSPKDATETTASAARLLSDWASRYIKAKESDESINFTCDKKASTATEVEGKKVFKLDDLVYGYYVVVTVDNDSDDEGYVINQSILNVPDASNVTLKATPITIDKSVSNLVDANNKNNGKTGDNLKNDTTTKLDFDEENGTLYDKITANIGDVLQYRVASHIPSLTSYDLSDTTKLVDIDTKIEASDFETDDGGNFKDGSAINGKYVYTFRDTMTNQDFIPTDVTDTKVYGTKVDGLKMEIYDAEGKAVVATYVVKVGENGEYYLVLNEDSATKENAIGRLWETDYDEVTVAGKQVYQNFFAINFDLKKLKEKHYDGRNIVFTYNAELKGETRNDDAVNNATLTYSNDPFDSNSTDTISDSDNVYTYDVKIDKLFSDGATTDFYDKVKFKLYSQDSSVKDRKAIKFVKTSDGSYTRADSDDSTTTTTTDDLAINTDNGTLLLHGLGEGTYYLEEQDENNLLSDAGYNIVNPITIVVKAKDDSQNITDDQTFDLFKKVGDEGAQTDKTETTVTLDEVNLPLKAVSNEYGVEFDVINQKGFKLPLTGEYGNWALAIAGILIVAVSGTVIVLVNRRKKDSSADNEA